MNKINFWFSIGSTYTYLSVNRILEIEKKENFPKLELPKLKKVK